MASEPDFEQIVADHDEEHCPSAEQAAQAYQRWLAGESR